MLSKPSALELYDLAEEYYRAANVLQQHKTLYFSPVFYSALHSIELCLKALLAERGLSRKELKKLGHDLKAITKKAKDLGCLPQFNPQHERALHECAEEYMQKCFEYPEPMVSTLPLGQWLEIASELLQARKHPVKE